MLLEPSPLRRWALRRAAIPHPGVVEIELGGPAILPRSLAVGQVELPLLVLESLPPAEPLLQRATVLSSRLPHLNRAVVSGNWAAMAAGVADDCHLPLLPPSLASLPFAPLADPPATDTGGFDLLEPPSWIMLRPEKLALAVPEIVDLFVALTRPGREGKAYGAAVSSATPTSAPLPTPSQYPVATSATARCRHGLRRESCAICQRELERALQPARWGERTVGRTVDLFDLLLPYLQPPVEALLAQPVLFPPARRPYDYQIEGIKFLAEHPSALLGDEMGLGKTIQAIVALQVLYRRGQARQTLVLCPRSLLGTWERELAKWAAELFVLQVRGAKQERLELWRAPASIYLTTYETLRQDIDDRPNLAVRFQVILLDEVQKIKNPSTGMARAVQRIQPAYRWALSGTPLENKLDDVAAIYGYLKPGLFRRDEMLTAASVKQRIAPYFLRRRTADVRRELPEKVVNEVWLDLTHRQRTTYAKAEEAAKQELSGPGATRVHAFALVQKLKQICNLDPASGESCKVDYLRDQLDAIVENDQKALVFSHLPNVSLAAITPQLQEYHPALFSGSLSDRQREDLIQSFQSQPRPSVLLMSVQAGGVGLTLTAANHVFHYDHWWNPAVARQAEGRAHRIGQTATVFVHDLYTVDTVEERIHHLLQTKQQLFDAVIDDLSAEYVQGAISDAELFALFGLTPPPTAKPASPAQPVLARNGTSASVQPAAPPASASVRQPPTTTGPVTAAVPRATLVPSVPSPVAARSPQSLSELSPARFMQLVAALYQQMGYATEVFGRPGDGGINIIGRHAANGDAKMILIQCIHAPEVTLDVPLIRRLLDLWQSHRQADAAILATSARVTPAAQDLATLQRIVLLDRATLQRALNAALQPAYAQEGKQYGNPAQRTS